MSNAFTFLYNSLQNHVILALLVMVGPGKLMVGPQALVGLGLAKLLDLFLL